MRKSFTLALAAAALAFGGFAARADNLQDGTKAFQAGQYNRALALWRPMATQGNPVAQNNLGIMYLDGKGVPQNMSGALRVAVRGGQFLAGPEQSGRPLS